MDITICDDAFIDLINAVTAEEIAALESSVDDLESELRDKADEDYVDDMAVDLRAEWQQEIESAIDNIEASNVDAIEDEVNEIQRELITVNQQLAELELGHADLNSELRDCRRMQAFYAEKIDALENTFFKRAYRKLMALSSKINWYSPRI